MGARENNGFEAEMHYTNNNARSKEAEAGEVNMTPEEKKRERILIYKNVIIVSVSFLLLFVAFESMSKLQSSINTEKNLGTWANVMVYISLVISCMFLPSLLIKKLKVKWALVVCVFCYSTYIAAQFKPSFASLIPTAFILGLGAAPMWSAKCTYLTQIANRMATINGDAVEPYIVKFFGIFFFFFQCNSILGNIISTAILSSGAPADQLSDATIAATCGSNYCPAKLVEDETPVVETIVSNLTDAASNFGVSDESRYTLAGVYLACSVGAAIILAIFLDPLSRFGETESRQNQESLSGLSLLFATFKHMKNRDQLLIIPLTIWSGVEQGFFGADFTAGFVTCAYGVHIVGRVIICYGVFDALASVSFGFVIKKIGRVPIFCLGALINIGVLITLFTYTPTASNYAAVYVLAALWGIGDAIWQTQINALYGILFPSKEEAAFSNYRLWESMGFIIAFITQASGLCIFPKIIITLVVLFFGMAGYFVVEYFQYKARQ